jgi:hypothetical protein
MFALITALFSWLVCRFRSRAALELEIVALRHQVAVLRRRRPGRPKLTSVDRLLWVWLYQIWPRCLEVMMLVQPATVIQWHRQGFRLYWHWRSRAGRPRADREVRELIWQMSSANPLWGALRIHGESPQDRYRGQPGYGRQVHVAKIGCAFTELALFPAQSGRGHRRDRHVCGCLSVFSAFVCDGHFGPLSQEDFCTEACSI